MILPPSVLDCLLSVSFNKGHDANYRGKFPSIVLAQNYHSSNTTLNIYFGDRGSCCHAYMYIPNTRYRKTLEKFSYLHKISFRRIQLNFRFEFDAAINGNVSKSLWSFVAFRFFLFFFSIICGPCSLTYYELVIMQTNEGGKKIKEKNFYRIDKRKFGYRFCILTEYSSYWCSQSHSLNEID